MKPEADGARESQDRQRMVSDQIAWRGIRDQRVLEAMRQTPRHLFVPPDYQHLAYTDGPLPIGKGQTISQPYIVALMTECLKLKGEEKVLEIGTGSGYQAAVLAFLAKEVHTIERHALLAESAREVFEKLALTNIQVHIGDGSLGLPAFAPFDAILVTAAAPRVPHPLLEQLNDGGCLVLPVGSRGSQVLECWQRQGAKFENHSILPVAFVPLRGEHGWKDDRWDQD
jgi:protein-L-isoaspartate(D-aspartate) O-methyltransferase